MTCSGGYCHTCWGIMKLVVGGLFVANHFMAFTDYWLLIGVLLMLAGIMKLVKPTCPHCVEPKTTMAAKAAKKR